MNPTDDHAPEAFFADVLLALKRARQRRDRHYFPLGADAASDSYWEPATSRTGGVQRHAMAAGDGGALLAALAEHWLAVGEDELASLQPELEVLRSRLQEAAPLARDRPSAPSYSAYPLF